jgi:hypothetical protein
MCEVRITERLKELFMDKWSFGITMTVVGMGGTFITLGIIILLTNLFKKVFPVSSENQSGKK